MGPKIKYHTVSREIRALSDISRNIKSDAISAFVKWMGNFPEVKRTLGTPPDLPETAWVYPGHATHEKEDLILINWKPQSKQQ